MKEDNTYYLYEHKDNPEVRYFAREYSSEEFEIRVPMDRDGELAPNDISGGLMPKECFVGEGAIYRPVGFRG